jgi:hypothetical protein
LQFFFSLKGKKKNEKEAAGKKTRLIAFFQPLKKAIIYTSFF